MTKQTALYDCHLQAGATVTEFAGWAMPVRYTSEMGEHLAVRTAAGLFDLSHMGQIRLLGTSAAEMLDTAVVSRVGVLAQGKAKYTLMCSEDGGIVDDLIVYRLADDDFLVIANASNTEAVLTRLEQQARKTPVTVEHCDQRVLLAVQGPRAVSILGQLAEQPFDDQSYYSIRPNRLAGHDVLLARTGYTGEDGFEISGAISDAVHLWEALVQAGSPLGMNPAGLAARDTLRLEAGMPLYGHELTFETSPYEAGLGRVVHLDKQLFTGRDALLKLATVEPKRKLVGLIATEKRIPRAGYEVQDPNSGKGIGWVTSGAPSPSLGYPIAMAYIDATSTAEVVHVDVRGRAAPASVVALPFYRRQKGN